MQIVQRLRDLQNRFGYLPDAELRALAKSLGVPLARLEEITTFFPAFRPERDKPAALEVRVCRDMTCHLRGAADLIAAGNTLAEKLNESGCDVRVDGVSCLGRCDRAPVAWVECRSMPDDEHAWVYTGLRKGQFLSLLQTLAMDNPRPEPDTDAGYEPHTNATFAPPRVEGPDGPDGEAVPYPDGLPAPAWEMDIYGNLGWPREYRAVRGFADFLAQRRRWAVPRPPAGLKGEAVKEYVRDYHPWLWRLSDAKLGGMGGALASVYQKWFDVWDQRAATDTEESAGRLDGVPSPSSVKYVVANGDESEPGTFKDREVMLRLPHLVVEGVILAGLIVGASEGFIFVRHEYHEQIAVLRAEVARAEQLGACGANVFGSGRAFPVTVFESPGGYICGEQSALIEAMEDRRGQPRNKPPEITANGFRDRPTVLNNVETLAWIPHVMLAGADVPDYPSRGWRPSRVPGVAAPLVRFGGRRLFSVSGDVKRPGVYDVPIGLPLGELLDNPKYCGGVTGTLKAVATSGPSGGFLPARLPLSFQVRERLAELRARLLTAGVPAGPPKPLAFEEWFVIAYVPTGTAHVDLRTVPLDKAAFDWLKSSGVAPLAPLLGAGIAVYTEGANILDQAVNASEFFRNESCGKCVPCRIGTQKLVQLGASLVAKRTAGKVMTNDVMEAERDVTDLTLALTQMSICSLGGSAPNPLATALTYFPNDARPPTG